MGLSVNIKHALQVKKKKPSDLAKALKRDPQQIYNCLYRDTFISKTGTEIASALNCDIVLIDRETGKIY